MEAGPIMQDLFQGSFSIPHLTISFKTLLLIQFVSIHAIYFLSHSFLNVTFQFKNHLVVWGQISGDPERIR